MTAGGGWVNMDPRTPWGLGQVASSLGHPVSALPVRDRDVAVQIARCTGACCRSIALHGVWGGTLNEHDLRRMGQFARDLKAGRRRQGWRSSFAGFTGLVFTEIERISRLFVAAAPFTDRDGQTAQHFRCKKLLANGDCGIYDDRPRLCSEHAGRRLCDVGGCTLLVQINPLVLRDPAMPPQVPPTEWADLADWPAELTP